MRTNDNDYAAERVNKNSLASFIGAILSEQQRTAMFQRRWLVLAALAILAIITIGAILLLLSPIDSINRRNLNRIEVGMTAARVEEILGRAPDEIMTVGGIELFRVWTGARLTIQVSFNEKGLVTFRDAMPFGREGQESFFDRLRANLP
jgi:hypothetical protein